MIDQRPLVGILCSRADDDGVEAESLRSVYLDALREGANVDCVILPTNLSQRAAVRILARLDGLVLTGAVSNVAPERYGSDRVETAIDIPRDNSAFALISAACHHNISILGICRGLQEMNVAFGGTLAATPPVTSSHPDHHEDLRLRRDLQYAHKHALDVVPGGTLAALLGSAAEVMVNSLHHQCIDKCALRVEARSKDGIVEAASIAIHGGFALGVQWHPEWFHRTDPVSQSILRGFGMACRQRQHLQSVLAV
ncbi:gamma-glutamyl-gamma-aminobutyrate hydrolase family protein [Roseobacter weihaiensis]|uniref:gamma-glutamyl-gamma-aminobutyrate hydrolase family protein n=1 Tax=Roseobacter weihaiensis TaxID=2763262 RepID=UPI001D09CE2D